MVEVGNRETIIQISFELEFTDPTTSTEIISPIPKDDTIEYQFHPKEINPNTMVSVQIIDNPNVPSNFKYQYVRSVNNEDVLTDFDNEDNPLRIGAGDANEFRSQNHYIYYNKADANVDVVTNELYDDYFYSRVAPDMERVNPGTTSAFVNGSTADNTNQIYQFEIVKFLRGPDYYVKFIHLGFRVAATSAAVLPDGSTADGNAGSNDYPEWAFIRTQFADGVEELDGTGFNQASTVGFLNVQLAPEYASAEDLTTILPEGYRTAGFADFPFNPSNQNVYVLTSNTNVRYYTFVNNVVRVDYGMMDDDNNFLTQLLPYHTTQTRVDPNVFVGGTPFQMCMVPLYKWFKSYNIAYKGDVARRVYSIEDEVEKWGRLSTESFRKRCYQDGELHPYSVSVFNKLDKQIRVMPLPSVKRFFEKAQVALNITNQNAFTIQFELENIANMMYAAIDLSTPVDQTTSPNYEFRQVSPLFTTSYVSGNTSLQVNNQNVGSPSKQYNILYHANKVPNLLFFRLRTTGREQTPEEIAMAKQLMMNGFYFVDTDLYQEYHYFDPEDTRQVRIILEGLLGAATGIMLKFVPELNYGESDYANKIGSAAPNVYYDDIFRVNDQPCEVFIGRTQSPYIITKTPMPIHHMKVGLMEHQNPFLRALPAIAAPYHNPDIGIPTFVTNQTVHDVYTCVPLLTFPFSGNYYKSWTGDDVGHTWFKGDCQIAIDNIQTIMRGMQGRIDPERIPGTNGGDPTFVSQMPSFAPTTDSNGNARPVFNLNETIYNYITRGLFKNVRIEATAHVLTVFKFDETNLQKMLLYMPQDYKFR